MTVSVIIPAYNSAKTIERALESVATQTVKPLEILVVDDGSTDATWQTLESYEGFVRGMPLRIFRQKNAGAGAARNLAIAHASGDYLAFLDADDEWLPEKLEKSLRTLRAGDHLLVAHNVTNVYPDGREEEINCAANFQRPGDPRATMFLRNFVAISAVVVQREAVVAVGGFDGARRYSLDFDLWNALFTQFPQATFTVFPEVLTRYHITPGALSSQVLPRLRDRREYIRRYLPAAVQWTGKPAIFLLALAVAVVHYEALGASRANGKWMDALRVVVAAPFSFIWLLPILWRHPRILPRENFLPTV